MPSTRSSRSTPAPFSRFLEIAALAAGRAHTYQEDDDVWCVLVHDGVRLTMARLRRSVRQSVSLPSTVARRVQALAKRRRISANSVIVDLIESGLEAKEREKVAFFELADRLAGSSDRAEQKRLKEELARMTFGEP